MKTNNGMLIYKNWLETRWRFLAALVLLSAIVVYAVLRSGSVIHDREAFRPGEHIIYAQYIWIMLYKGHLQALWILSTVMLGMGGLWRERASGVAAFALSLPVSRRRLVLVRAAVGAAEAIILALVPSILIWLFSPLADKSYPLAEALLHSILFVGGGLVFYGLGLLISHLMQGEFSVPALSLGLCLVSYIAFQVLRFKTFNPFDLMSGKYYLDPNTFLLRGTLPWIPLFIFVLLLCVTIFISIRIAQSRDF
jgi:ABC-type transport system involved in multi-copper enzyme maturation permease subunit